MKSVFFYIGYHQRSLELWLIDKYNYYVKGHTK
jgi:hypothetical protein